jgi:O-antigen/teichoic acid export membrane protein
VLRISAVWADQSTEKAEKAEKAERRVRAFFWLRLGLAAVIASVGCAAAALISSTFLNGVDEGLLRWALLGIVATAASGAVSATLQATGAFGRMSSLTLVNTGLTVILAVLLAVAHRLDLWSALVILGIGTSIATFCAGVLVLPPGWRLSVPSTRALIPEARQLMQTGRWLWLASLFAMLTANAEVLLLNRWAALPLVGAYALALNLASKADVVNHSLYTVLLPGVANLDRRDSLRSYSRRGLIRSGAIGIGLLLLIPFAEPFIVNVYGADFAQAAVFLQLLLGVMIFDIVLTPFLLLPLAYRQPRLLALGDALRAITLVLVGIGLIPTYGAFGAIGARLASRLAGAVVVLGALYSGRQTLEVQNKEAAGVLE